MKIALLIAFLAVFTAKSSCHRFTKKEKERRKGLKPSPNLTIQYTNHENISKPNNTIEINKNYIDDQTHISNKHDRDLYSKEKILWMACLASLIPLIFASFLAFFIIKIRLDDKRIGLIAKVIGWLAVFSLLYTIFVDFRQINDGFITLNSFFFCWTFGILKKMVKDMPKISFIFGIFDFTLKYLLYGLFIQFSNSTNSSYNM